MDRLGVVILPDGATGDAVERMIADWASAGIVSRLLVVRSSGVVESPPQPVEVTATLLERGDERDVDLFSYLSRFRLETVRLVLVQVLPDAQTASPELTRLADHVALALARSLPLDPRGHPLTTLHRTVLVVPASGVTGAPPSILEPRWEANVVVSPEDRPDLDRQSVFIRPERNLAGHAAAAVCAAAGVIRGIDDGVLDQVSNDSATSPEDVVVVRVSIRSVIGENTLDLLTRRTLEPAALGRAGPATVVPWCSPASEPEGLIRRATKTILTGSEWGPTPPPEPQVEDPSVRRVWSAFKEAVRFNARTVAAVAAWTVSRGRDHLDTFATQELVGADSGVIVTVGPRVLPQFADFAARRIAAERDRLDEAVAHDAARGSVPPPSTWSMLRAMALGLADGSPLPGMDDPQQLGKREVLAPSDVVPDGRDLFERPDGSTIEPSNPPAMRAYRDELARATDDARRKADALRRDCETLRRQLDAALERAEVASSSDHELDDPRREGVPSDGQSPEPDANNTPTDLGGTRPDTATSTEAAAATVEAPAPEARPASPEANGLSERLAELAAEYESAVVVLQAQEECEQAYAGWFERVAGTVMWRVGDDVARRLVQCEAQRLEFRRSTADAVAPVADFLQDARTRLLHTWWWMLGLGALGIVALFLIPPRIVDDVNWRAVWWAAAGIVLLAVVVLVSANHAFYKALRKYEWQIKHVLAQQRLETERFLWAGRELTRMRALFAGWRVWTSVISEVLHRTWQPPAAGYDDLSDDVVDQLPASVAVARQQDQVELPPLVVASAYGELYPRTWASTAFSSAYSKFAERFAGTESDGYLDVDTDAMPTELSPLGQLEEYWVSGAARSYVGELQYERLRRADAEGTIHLPEREVTRIGPFSDDLAHAEREYFRAITTASTTFALDAFDSRARSANKHYVSRSRIWLPSIVGSVRLAPPRQEESDGERHARSILGTASGSTALRIDISHRMRPDALDVFDRARRTSGESSERADDDGWN